jgi:effector-binding domain-containing protein
LCLLVFAAVVLSACPSGTKAPGPVHGKPTPPPPPHEEKPVTAEDIVNRAIKVAGGLDRLRKGLSALTARVTGTHSGMPFTGTTYWKAPDRLATRINPGNRGSGHAAKACWNTYHDIVVGCTAVDARATRQSVYVGHITNLYPLKSRAFTLQLGESVEVAGRPAVGVRVTKKGAPVPVTLYFDRESAVLLKAAYRGQWVRRGTLIEMIFLDHKDFGGIKLATRSILKVNGRTITVERVLSVDLGKVDESKLKKPPQVRFGAARTRTVPARTVVFSTHKGPHKGRYNTLTGQAGMMAVWVIERGLMIYGPLEFRLVKGPDNTKNPAQYVTEVGFPVTPPKKSLPSHPFLKMKKTAAETIAVRAEKGPPFSHGPKFKQLAAWISRNNYVIAGPAGMIVYQDPTRTPPSKVISELFYPVRRK